MAKRSSTNSHGLQLLGPFDEKLLAAASDVSGRAQTSSTVRRRQSLREVNDRVPPSRTSLDANLTRLQGSHSPFQRWLDEPPQNISERWLAEQVSKPLKRRLVGRLRSRSRRQFDETSWSLSSCQFDETSRSFSPRRREETSWSPPGPGKVTETKAWFGTTVTKLDKPPRRVLASLGNPNKRPPDTRNDPYTFGSIVKPLVALKRPQVVLFGGDVLWIFAGVTLPQFLTKVSVYGIGTTQLPPEDGVDEQSRTSSSQLGWSSQDHVDSGRIGKQKSNRVKFSNQGTQATPKVGGRGGGRDDEVRFGCPFSKHNPVRYLTVRGRNRNPCTDPPGLEYGHIR
jgi:hypothetical protein